MKNYIYSFKFGSGYYENDFFKQVPAENIKEALNQIYAEFCNMDIDSAIEYLNDELGESWTESDFWEKIKMPIFSSGDMEAYRLDDVREIQFDLDKI